jgi:hypothetical protein
MNKNKITELDAKILECMSHYGFISPKKIAYILLENGSGWMIDYGISSAVNNELFSLSQIRAMREVDLHNKIIQRLRQLQKRGKVIITRKGKVLSYMNNLESLWSLPLYGTKEELLEREKRILESQPKKKRTTLRCV